MLLPMIAMLAAADTDTDGFYYRKPPKKFRPERELSETEKLKRHREYGTDQTKHKYLIRGVEIIATSKKVALKIYEKRTKKKTTQDD